MGSKVLSRLSSTRLQSLSIKLKTTKATLPTISPLKSTSSQSQVSSSLNRISLLSRLPVELSSMMPLHSAIASARLQSSLSIESQSWGLIPQGISMPL